jgi:hypothetical protein
MGDRYTVEKIEGEWLISVAGVGFFRCGKRRDAVQIAKLASELLNRAVKDSASRSSGIFAPDTPARGGKHR